VKRDLGEGFELDDDRDRVDVDAVHRFLSEESYWARGRDLETVKTILGDAVRIVGLYHDGRMIGFSRAARCAPKLLYLGDVYVLEDYRGRGLGVELVREMIDNGPYADAKWLLHTEDAHELYRRFGFEEPGYRLMERPAR
jgi:GNAT superfamily N-acetyltransferase